jgi:phage baseplate assembly protein W
MSSLAVKLPITRDTSDSYTMIDDFESLIRQNLKMLILTSQGERIMEPEFGVGIRNFLFENFNDMTYNAINQKIRKQAEMFMPAIKILEVGFAGSDLDRNLLGIQVFYSVPDIGITDLLEFTI